MYNGVREMINAEKELEKTAFSYVSDKKPNFDISCTSLLSKTLTKEIWDKLKDKKDSFGCTLGHIINSGVVNQDSSIGVYAGSEESYTVFALLFDPIIESYHNHKKDAQHISN